MTGIINAVYTKTVVLFNKHFPVTLARLRFRKLFGRKLHLCNPQDLNEKILWLSLYSDTTEWSRLADKYAVREYVRDRGCEDLLVKLYGKWDSVDDVEWDKLPESFVLKTNNGAGTVMVVEEKKRMDIDKTKQILRRWLDNDVSNRTTEFHYRSIRPCIIAEELIVMSDTDKELSTSIIDYKIWCFNGKPDSILVCSNRIADGCCLSVYDTEWNYHPEALVFDRYHHERNTQIPKPNNFDKMLDAATRLSYGFPEVRVDLYNISGKIYFGEMTFTSFGGTMTYYTDQELLRMGQKIGFSDVKKKKK